MIIIDVSNNVAALNNETKKLGLYFKMLDELSKFFNNPKIIGIADAKLRHSIDERGKYEQLCRSGKIYQAPPERYADYFIITFFKRKYAHNPKQVWLVSNDRYREFHLSQELQENIIRFAVIDEEVILHNEKLLDLSS